MLEEQRNWKTAWLERSIERMEERLKKGETEVVLHIEEFQHILAQLLAAHRHSDRLEETLISYARYAFPVPQQLVAPAIFGGGTVSGRSTTASGAVEQVEKKPAYKCICGAIGALSLHTQTCKDYNWNITHPKAEQDKAIAKKLNEHCHVFIGAVGSGYGVCECGISDVYYYYNWAYKSKS